MTVTWDVGKTSLTNSEEGRVRNGTFSCSWGSSLGVGGEGTLAKTPPTPCGGDGNRRGSRDLRSKALPADEHSDLVPSRLGSGSGKNWRPQRQPVGPRRTQQPQVELCSLTLETGTRGETQEGISVHQIHYQVCREVPL